MKASGDQGDVPGYDEAISRFIESCDSSPLPSGLLMAVARESTRQRRARTVRRVCLALLVPVILAGGSVFWFGTLFGGNLNIASATSAPVICPHGSSAPAQVVKTNHVASVKFEEFLQNPDRFKRVCYCRPSFSGSLREETGTTVQ